MKTVNMIVWGILGAAVAAAILMTNTKPDSFAVSVIALLATIIFGGAIGVAIAQHIGKDDTR